MKKFVLALILALLPSFALANCQALMAKYNAPNPASKTMVQIQRWIRNNVSNANEANTLQECLFAGAADNPNQASFAGR